MSKQSEEQRDLFRIKDNVTINFERVSAEDVKNHTPEYFLPSTASFNLIKELYSLMDFTGSSQLRVPYLDTSYFRNSLLLTF